MTLLESVAEKVRKGEPLPAYLRAALTAATPLYRAGMIVRGLRTPVKVDARVISYGNLTAGGTGKTPAVVERAATELAEGNRVAILTRGYGATKRRDEIVCTCGEDAAGMAEVIGDEPALIARRVPGVVIARSSDRVAAAQRAMAEYGCNVLILDDGFQYLRLARDENVLVVDASDPFGNGKLIPRGVLREPIASAARATHIVLTHCDRVSAEQRGELEAQLRAVCPGTPIRATYHAPDTMWPLAGGERLPLDALRGKDVTAVCAIARPESFLATLTSLGAVVVGSRFFPDHGRIPADALKGEAMIVVTEKDAVRIPNGPENVYALGVRLAPFE